MESNQQRFPKLKGSNNYEIWSIRMEASICEKGYLDVMTLVDLSGYDEATVKELIVKRNDRTFRAAAIIRLSLEDGPLIQTRGISDALDLWNRLKALYEPTGFSSEFLTCKELFSTTLAKCGNSVEAYLTKVKRLTDDLAARNLAIPNKVIAAYTLNNLTSDYENTVAIISQSYRTHTGDINLIELFSQLVDESRRVSAKEPIEMALNITPNQSRVKDSVKKEKRPIKCYRCSGLGHFAKNCDKQDQEDSATLAL
jgi:gag-polypeptide of LTR copia-type/Zinc knuckle